MPTIKELTRKKEPEKEFYLPGKCPVCGGSEIITEDIYETSHNGKNGEKVDCVDMECDCEECGSRFTMVYEMSYLKTIDVKECHDEE